MTITTRHTLLRASLIAFVLVDVLLLTSFIFDECLVRRLASHSVSRWSWHCRLPCW